MIKELKNNNNKKINKRMKKVNYLQVKKMKMNLDLKEMKMKVNCHQEVKMKMILA